MRGKIIETEELPAYCAVALAGIGNLPDTITGRSIILKMRRRAPNEKVEPWRERITRDTTTRLHDRLAAWARQVEEGLMNFYPAMPDGIEDRAADMWEPLLAVADKAGGNWPERARKACVFLVKESRDSTASLGVRLLADLRQVFGTESSMGTKGILEALHNLDEAPWAEMKGKPLDARGLANLLKPYDVHSGTIRIGSVTAKGYTRENLSDAWGRYLPIECENQPDDSLVKPGY